MIIPNVLVLMSTYNGERYLREQLDSILGQEGVNVELFIRDDGSTDATVNILKEYEDNNKCKVVYGKNIGASKSFLWLIGNCAHCDFYSFSDQDDIWLNDKLITSVQALINNKADLYHGLAGRVSKDLQTLPSISYRPRNNFGAALMSSATGCTMVFSHRLMKIIRTYIPENISMHDAWVYRVAYATGVSVYYDFKSHMLYRQHEHNVSGGQMSFWDKLKKIRSNRGLKYNVAEELSRGFINLITEENKNTLRNFLNYKESFFGKIKVLFSSTYNVNSKKTNILNKVLFAFNMI